jgi:hypothetical protein
MEESRQQSESVLNSVMAAYVFDDYARLLNYVGGQADRAAAAREKAREQRQAARAQWTGQWFRRAWLGPTLGWLGEKGIWLAPQPWAVIGGVTSPAETTELLRTVDQRLRRPSPIGAMQMDRSPDIPEHGLWEVGTAVFGGVWPSLNATLIWALAMVDGAMAWDEWKKNSFARHAEVYPEVWYGTWSGPDTLNSAMSKSPGKTFGTWPDFPVFNMHSHACALYATTKLLGVDFTEGGMNLAPAIPLESYRFDSPLLGVVKPTGGYDGWYAPATSGTWTINLRLPAKEAAMISRVEVNGAPATPARTTAAAFQLQGESSPGKPLHWKLLL